MGKTKKPAAAHYSARVQQLIIQVRKGRFPDPQVVKASISRMLDQELKI